MPLSVAFRWKTPQALQVKTMWDRTGAGDGLSQAADAIAAGRQRKYERERQQKLDKQAEEDRQRRIDWEDRQRKAYGEAADYMRGRSADRDALVKRADQLRQEIVALKMQLGG